jgi:hypothetical protein
VGRAACTRSAVVLGVGRLSFLRHRVGSHLGRGRAACGRDRSPGTGDRRRGKGKTDQIDASLAILAALRLDTSRRPTPPPTVTARRYGSCWMPATN